LCGTLSQIERPGVIRSIGSVHMIKLGELDGSASERTGALLQVLRRAGVNASIPENIHVALWEKFLFVVPVGGIGAVTRAPIGTTRSLPQTRRLLEQAMREIFDVARARNVSLSDDAIARTMAFVDTLAPAGTASLQRDIADGKPSELEAWNGAVVRLGREAGVPTPLHEFIYHSLLPLERRARGDIQFPG
jgi:2-dehydropantoate 2-reductase